LPVKVSDKTLDACDQALALDEAKKKMQSFVESQMGYIDGAIKKLETILDVYKKHFSKTSAWLKTSTVVLKKEVF
jgi:hypothetical protein